MISCYNSSNSVNGFSIPFSESTNYLGMNYLGNIHTWVELGIITPEVKSIIDDFKKKLQLKSS